MTGHTLILLRHAKSDWSGSHADLDRPLARRGRRQAAEAGRLLAYRVSGTDSSNAIDLAVVSPATRARSTWDLVSAQLENAPPTRIDERVYEASGRDLLTIVRELPEDLRSVLLLGHNPGLEDLATSLTNERVAMLTSGLAVIEPAATWSSLGETPAVLRAAGRPPVIG
jgi:phosphohistidine phosphatase